MSKAARKASVSGIFHANLNPFEIFRKFNNLIELTSRSSADTDSLHGDGLFPIAKDTNGIVEAGTGLNVKINDYLGLIDGYKVHLSAAKVFSGNKFQTLTTTKTGEFYVGLALTGIDIDATAITQDADEGEKDKQIETKEKYGFLPEHGEAVPVEIDASEVTVVGGKIEVEGKIVLAKLNVPAETTQITAAMIDNSVKDYLIDLDILNRDVNYKINEVRADLYQEIIDAVGALRIEIADGDQDVLDAVDTKLAVINSNIESIQEEVDELKVNCADLAEYIADELAPRVDQLSDDLEQAVTDLTELVENEVELLDEKIEDNLGKIAILQTDVQAPVTGLKDRVQVLEDEPTVPIDVLDRLDELEEKVAELEEQCSAGPTVTNHLIEVADLDGSSTYDLLEGAFTLPINTLPFLLQDTFDADGALDPAKWLVVGGTPSQSGGELNLKNLDRIRTVSSLKHTELEYDIKIPAGVKVTDQGVYTLLRRNVGTNTHYEVHLVTYKDPNYLFVKFRKIVSGAQKYKVVKHLTDLVLTAGTSVNVKVSIINNHVIIKVNDVERVNVYDVSLGGVPAIDQTGVVEFIGRHQTHDMDNVEIKDPVSGPTYETSGIILTNQLASVSPILAAFLQGSVDIPVDTSIQYEVSLNGGTNWSTVTLLELVDGTQAPWSGAGTDYRVKVTLGTTDTSKTPTVDSLRAVSEK